MKRIDTINDLYRLGNNEMGRYKSRNMYIKRRDNTQVFEVYSYNSLVGVMYPTPYHHPDGTTKTTYQFNTTRVILDQWKRDCYYNGGNGATTNRQITMLCREFNMKYMLYELDN